MGAMGGWAAGDERDPGAQRGRRRLTPAELAYQTARHIRIHMQQWPRSDRVEVERDIRKRLQSGQAWLWPWPEQLSLFDSAGR